MLFHISQVHFGSKLNALIVSSSQNINSKLPKRKSHLNTSQNGFRLETSNWETKLPACVVPAALYNLGASQTGRRSRFIFRANWTRQGTGQRTGQGEPIIATGRSTGPRLDRGPDKGRDTELDTGLAPEPCTKQYDIDTGPDKAPDNKVHNEWIGCSQPLCGPRVDRTRGGAWPRSGPKQAFPNVIRSNF